MSDVSLLVAPGTRVRCLGNEFVITHVLDLESVLARRIADGGVERLRVLDLQPITTTQSAPLSDLDLPGVSEAHWTVAEARYQAIRPLLETPQSERTRASVEAVARRSGVHWTTIYRWTALYETTGRLSSLLPMSRLGGRGKSRLDDGVEEILSTVVQNHYLTSQKKSQEKIVVEVRAACIGAGLPPPSPSTIRRRIGDVEERQRTRAREGSKAAAQAYGARPGRLLVERPLEASQIDHTLLDIMVVDAIDRLPIGRPWITILIDVFSRVVLGFYLSLDPPGTMGTGLAIAHAVLPKDGWLLRRGVQSKWPCWGFPTKIMADNAREFRGHSLARACLEYRCHLEFRPVGKPHYGSHIERLMGTVANEIHALPGTTFSNPTKRGQYDSEAKAIFSLDELETWLARWFSEVYHCRAHRGLGGRTPVAVFEEAILQIGLPPRILNEERLRIDFMPHFERTVQQGHVTIDNVRYWSDILTPYVKRHAKDDPRRLLKLRFHRDPRDISRVYFHDPVRGEYTAIPYRNISHPSISIWEFRAARTAALATGRADVNESAVFAAHQRLHEQQHAAATLTKQAHRDRQRKVRLAAEREEQAATRASVVRDANEPHRPQSDTPAAPPTPPADPYDEFDPLEDLSWLDRPS